MLNASRSDLFTPGSARPYAAGLLVGLLSLGVACGDDDVTPDGSVSRADAASDSAGNDGATETDARATDGSTADGSTPDGTTPRRDSGEANVGLSARYPGDEGIGDDPAVLFHDDFESGWGRWDAPREDTPYLTIQRGPEANAGEAYMRSRVTTADLAGDMYISSQSRVAFDQVDTVFWRFYARFPNVAPNPHHWVRMAAGDDDWNRSGLANTVPGGGDGFWFDFDASNNDEFNFYVYWHEMRSGRCNDGGTTPGCAGDQGNDYHYGNTFRPREQAAFPRDEWFCVEIAAGANSVGENDGWLAYYIDGAEVARFAPGQPNGTWLRDRFHEGGCEFTACTDPAPFEGFNFRTEADVGFKGIYMDAYYERGSSARKRTVLEERGLTVSDEQTIFYDDVVVATERIGCR